MNKVTFIVQTYEPRLRSFRGFILNLLEFTSDLSKIEVGVKIDRGDRLALLYIEYLESVLPFRLYHIVGEYNGYHTSGNYYNQLAMMSSDETYFLFECSDEVRFKDKKWLDYIFSFKNKFDDDIFLIKTSPRFESREAIYFQNDIIQRSVCVENPDTHPFYTKKLWLLSGGIGDIFSCNSSWCESILQILKYKYGEDRLIEADSHIWDTNSTHFDGGAKSDEWRKDNKLQMDKIKSDEVWKENFEYIAKILKAYISK